MKWKQLCLFALLTAGIQACGTTDPATEDPSEESDLCEQAQEKLQECFPDQPPPESCHGATAQQILDESCEDLVQADGKSDGGWLCFWNPFLCAGDSGGSDPYTLTVGISRCGTSLVGGNDCSYYSSSPCTAVALYQDGAEIARTHSSIRSAARFELEEGGEYEVRILDRHDDVAQRMTTMFGDEGAPAIETVSFGDSREARVTFDLAHDSEETVKRCAPVTVELSAETLSGEPVHAYDVEVDWLVRFLQEDGTVGLRRPLRLHPDASGEDDYVNRAYFSEIYAGDHIVEFIRMDIPSWAQTANPDLEDFLERYAVESVLPYSEEYSLDDADIPSGDRHSLVLIDPLRD